MKISVDTNVLVRAVLQDDASQGEAAATLLRSASLIAVSLPCLCELVWVLRRGAKLSVADVALTIRDLLGAGAVDLRGGDLHVERHDPQRGHGRHRKDGDEQDDGEQ